MPVVAFLTLLFIATPLITLERLASREFLIQNKGHILVNGVAKGIIFEYGAEKSPIGDVSAGDGTLPPWNNVQEQKSVAVEIVSSPVHSGTKAVKLGSLSGSGQPRAQLNWWDGESISLKEVYVSYWLYLPDGYKMDTWEMIFDQHDEDWNSLRKVHIVPVGGHFELRETATYSKSGVAVPRNKWTHVQQYYKLGASDGVMRVWQDGVLVIDKTGVDTSNGGASKTIAKINVKFYSSPENPRPSWKYIDDYVIASEKVPESYRVLDK